MLDGHQTPLGLSLQDRMPLEVRDLEVAMTEDVPREIEAAPMVSDPDVLSTEAPGSRCGEARSQGEGSRSGRE